MVTQIQLGQKIKNIRKAKGITQEKLAELIDVDFGYISKLEVGRNYPSIPTLSRIAEVLDVDISDFFIYYDLNELDIKKEISDILADLPLEKQIYVYKFIKSIE